MYTGDYFVSISFMMAGMKIFRDLYWPHSTNVFDITFFCCATTLKLQQHHAKKIFARTLMMFLDITFSPNRTCISKP